MNQLLIEGRAMLEQTSWVKINKQCYTLVDDEYKVLATICTSYDEKDGDENLIWDITIEGDELGSCVSLYLAKLLVQRAVYEWDIKVAKETQQKKKKKIEKKKIEKKKNSVVRK